MTFRPASLEDLEFCLYTKESSFRAIVELLKPYDTDKERLNMIGRIERGELEIVLVEEQPVGYFSTEESEGSLWLHNLFFPPEHQSCGYGSAVLRHIRERARQRQLPIRLRVLHVNPRAQSFYRREGMIEADSNGTHLYFTFPEP
jgi:GNAT superfamily N-acetyltransferase